LAAPAAAVVAVLVALRPVAAAVVLLVLLLELVVDLLQHLPLPARLLELAAALAQVVAKARLLDLAHRVVEARLVAEAQVLVELLSRQSSSAAMARITN
jgi:hypothetical protein